MPSRLTALGDIKDVVLLPVRFRTKGLPSGPIERRFLNTPTAVRQILKIQLTVIQIHRSLERADSVETFHHLIAAWSGQGTISKANACGIRPLQIFALMAYLSLIRRGPWTSGGGDHPQYTIASLVGIT